MSFFAWTWLGVLVILVLIGGVTALLMDHSDTRIHRQHGMLMDPEFDSYLERWHLAKKTR